MSAKILLFCVLAGFSVYIFSCKEKKETTPTIQKPVAGKNERPFMKVLLADGKQIEMAYVEEKMVLILFQPECEDCNHEADLIEKRIADFKDYKLYFISSQPLNEIQQFAIDHHLAQYSNVFFGKTSVEGVLSNYGAIAAPSIYVYSKDGMIVKMFHGMTDVDKIINAL